MTAVTLRAPNRPDDYPAMNAVMNAARLAEGNDWVTTDAEFANDFDNLSNCDPATDIFVAEGDGRIVGHARASWYQDHEGQRLYEPSTYVDPGAPVPGLLRLLTDRVESRLAEIAASHPPGPKLFQDVALETAAARIALLVERGYEPVRYEFEMVRPDLEDLPDAPLPDGLEIREVRPEHLPIIWAADEEAFRDHWGTSAYTAEDYQRFLHDPIGSDTTLWRIAWDGDQAAGQVRSFIHPLENERFRRKRGYVENISVRRPWRRRGLARALIAASFSLLRARGMTEGALGVDTENRSGALHLYESCGFVPVKRYIFYRRPLD